MADRRLTVCICGGGNGAHVLAGLAAAQAKVETRVLTLFQDEASRWTQLMKGNDFVIRVKKADGVSEEIRAKPFNVTDDASKAISGADLIVIVVPAFAHRCYFSAIKPHIQKGAAIIGLPGQPGFELQCVSVLGDAADCCAILSYESLPWATRIADFGRKVDLLGTKDALLGSVVNGDNCRGFDPVTVLQCLLGSKPQLRLANNFLETSLMTKAFVHPAIMHSKYKDWDGQPLRDRPLFYQGLTEDGASCVLGISDEVMATARAISMTRPAVTLDNVEHLEPWFIRTYYHSIKGPTSLHTAMVTNSAYDGLLDPMTEVAPGRWMPDFTHRYLQEDVPYGLAVLKGIAELAGVSTPVTDRVLQWCQYQMGMEFIVGSQLKGKDVHLTRSPQAFGYTTLDKLLSLLHV